ncbi:hypothetical protein BpHYR1_036511 [Brachionus plicatilis]|uniref:Uncharacterized protein n=1 Tax=Brachionus plicatilis TaxID=10195 RepID=A0A3M7RNM9_BRAPC|nr:hypothetical protein BpHYR1_036511 [Brachionus plicatilis]
MQLPLCQVGAVAQKGTGKHLPIIHWDRKGTYLCSKLTTKRTKKNWAKLFELVFWFIYIVC